MLKRTLVCVVAVALTTIGCDDGEKTNDKVVTLGAVIDRTGSIARPPWHDAVQLAIADANAGLKAYGGLSGLKFAYAGSDSTNTPAVAAERALELVQQYGAKMLVTDTSADATQVNMLDYDADSSNDIHVPRVCQACTSASINNSTAVNADPVTQAAYRNELKWQFRSTMTSKQGALVFMKLLTTVNGGDVNSDGKLKISFFNIDDGYGNGYFSDMNAAIVTLGLSPAPVIEQIKHVRDIDASSYNWAADAAKLADNFNETTQTADGYPDAVVVADFPQYAAAITKAYKVGGYTPRVMQTHNFRHDTVVVALGTDVNGQEGVSHAILDNGDSGVVFDNGMRARTGTGAGFWDANTYDATFTLLLACAKAVIAGGLSDPSQVTPAAIRDEMFNLNDKAAGMRIGTGAAEFAKALGAFEAGTPIDYFGASGPMDYGTDGNVLGKMARFMYEDGAFRDKELFDCITDPVNCPKIN